MSLLGDSMPSLSVHQVLDEEELFVEVIDRGVLGLCICCSGEVGVRFDARIVDRESFSSSICECPCDSDCSERLNPICIFHDFEFYASFKVFSALKTFSVSDILYDK